MHTAGCQSACASRLVSQAGWESALSPQAVSMPRFPSAATKHRPGRQHSAWAQRTAAAWCADRWRPRSCPHPPLLGIWGGGREPALWSEGGDRGVCPGGPLLTGSCGNAASTRCHLPRSRTLSPHRPRRDPSPFPGSRATGTSTTCAIPSTGLARYRQAPRDSGRWGRGGPGWWCQGGAADAPGALVLRPGRVPRGTHIFTKRGPLCFKRAQGVSVPPSSGRSQTGAPVGRGPHAGAGHQCALQPIRSGSRAGERGLRDGGGRCPHGAPRRGTAV